MSNLSTSIITGSSIGAALGACIFATGATDPRYPILSLLLLPPAAAFGGVLGAAEGAGMGYLAGKAIEAKTDSLTNVVALTVGIGGMIIGSFVSQMLTDHYVSPRYGSIASLLGGGMPVSD